MSRYIDADALMDALNVFKDRKNGNEHFMYGIETAKELLEIQPTVDAVPVVRCRDCKHRIVNEHYGEKGYFELKAYCKLDTGDIFELGRCADDDDWYCADGERRTV